MAIAQSIDQSLELGITSLPDHTQLPDSDGTFAKNFQEHPQSILLTDSTQSTLDLLHPDQQYASGQDCGIYWRLTQPPEKGAECPDWFYVPNVPPRMDNLDVIIPFTKISIRIAVAAVVG